MKYALITGSSGAIGSAIAQRLASAGHHVVLHANRQAAKVEALAEQIRKNGGSASTVLFDLTDSTASQQAVDTLLEQAPIQILVNNAGIHDDATFAGMSRPQWQSVLDVSLGGFYNVTQPLLLPMIRTRWGRIINLSSVAAITGNRGQVNYAAAKGAIQSATKSLALEVASRGITVNAIAPGIITSEMTEDVFDADTINRIVPMKRAGSPAEVAALAAFLASDDAAYITGQTLSINGGMI